MASDIVQQKRMMDENNLEINPKKLRTSESELHAATQSSFAVDRQKELHLNSSETDVGISEYINDLPGFYAVIKERYSDFVVNEIDPNGRIVRLTNMEKPKEEIPTADIADLIDDDTRRQIQDLVEKKVDNVVIEVTHKEKMTRKDIHEAIRHHFRGLDSCTEDRDQEKVIVVKRDAASKDRRFRPSSHGNYIQFVLYKENRDTMDAINTISSFLRIPSKSFSYAGTKDKRGKTSQMVTVYRVTTEKLFRINEKFSMIKVGNITYQSEQMRLGQLLGNHFVVILRQVKDSRDVISKAVASLETKGFINYYGMQRFGTTSIATHSIGRFLLLGEWKNAINLILRPRMEDENSNLAESRKIWKDTGDAKKAFCNLRQKSSIEGKLLEGLFSHNENDFVNALNAIPRNTRLMYIHSYQSYIWNQVVSRRIKKYGINVIVGDIVTDPRNEVLDMPDVVENTIDLEKKISVCDNIKEVTEENISQYSIQNVLFPLPGYNIKYPNNETKEWYNEILSQDGVNLSNFESKVRTYSLSGSYRKIVIVPSEVKWDIIPYNDVSLPLALSDLDVLQGQTLSDPPSDGSLQALKLEFSLPSSSYATMAIREVIKCDTCYSSHKLSAVPPDS